MELGISPLNALSRADNSIKASNDPISRGRLPEKLLLEIDSVDRFVAPAISGETPPENKFPWSSSK